MKAIRFHQHGASDVLKFEDAPDPKPGTGEVLVEIKAAGVNHLDIWVRNGLPSVKIPLPHIPGSDGAGVVAACGPGVKKLKEGDRVALSPGMGCGECERCKSGWDSLCDKYHLLGFQVDGTYAQKIVVPERRALKVSAKLSFEEWAAVPLVFLTAWHMLITHAHMKKGDRVLVHAAGSGIGHAAIQIAKLHGAQVFTTVGSADKADKAKKLGADHVINYREKDFAEEVKRLTDQKGVDIVFEHIGPETWAKSLSVLAKHGTLVTCGATSGPKVEIDLRFLYMRQQKIIGSYMGGHQELEEVISLVEKGKLKPIVDKTFPLKDAKAAHDHMDSRRFFGKIILSI